MDSFREATRIGKVDVKSLKFNFNNAFSINLAQGIGYSPKQQPYDKFRFEVEEIRLKMRKLEGVSESSPIWEMVESGLDLYYTEKFFHCTTKNTPSSFIKSNRFLDLLGKIVKRYDEICQHIPEHSLTLVLSFGGVEFESTGPKMDFKNRSEAVHKLNK